MQTKRITFIGGGNMAEALVAGLIKAKHKPDIITVTDQNKTRLEQLSTEYGVFCSDNNQTSVLEADIIVLAVKPQVMKNVLVGIGKSIPKAATVISIAAGISTEHIAEYTNRNDLNLVRVMPNTPALVGEAMSVLFSTASEEHKANAEYILAASGQTAWVESERLLHAATAVSGSGPAYFFLLAEAMQAAGIALGLPKELAGQLACQTAFGAGKMLAESGRDAATLRSQVTSPGGTTQAALDTMYDSDFPAIIRKAIQAAHQRSRELS